MEANKTQFIAEAQKYLDQSKSDTLQYVSILSRMSGNRQGAFELLFNKLMSLIKKNSNKVTNYTDTSASFDEYANYFTGEVINGTQYVDKSVQQNKKVFSTLGSIFASNTSAPLYFIKKTADELDYLSQSKIATMQSILATLLLIEQQLLKIESSSSEWYSANVLADTSSAANDINNAIGNLLVSESYAAAYKTTNLGELNLAKNRTLSAINYIAGNDSSAFMYDVEVYIESLERDTSSLETFDTKITDYVQNIQTSREEFPKMSSSNGKFGTYAQEAASAQRRELESVSRSMAAVIKTDNKLTAVAKTKEWVQKLATIAASIENTIVDYSEVINDDTHIDTAQLITYSANLSLPTRSINSTLVERIRLLINLIKQKLYVNTDIDTIIDLKNDITSSILEQNTYMGNIITDSSTYSPTVCPEVDEIIALTNSLGLDRAGEVLISSNWPNILGLNESNMSYSDIILSLLSSFINDIQDVEVKSVLLSLYYRIQAQKKKKMLLGITFDTMREVAIKSLLTKKLASIDYYSAQLSNVKDKI